MLRTSKTRRCVRTLALAAAALIAASPAVARKADRKRSHSAYEAASLIAIPHFSSPPARATATPPAPPAQPATFFTINDALAKHDGLRRDGAVRLAAADPAAIVDAPPSAQPVVSSRKTDEPFGMELFRAPEGALWIKWRRLSEQLGADEKTIAACSDDDCASSVRTFMNLVGQISGLTGRARLERANLVVNMAVRYATDIATHGEPDRWSSPLATLQAGRGDCEDYAFLKRQILLHAGVKPADLRIVLLRDTLARADHAVLAARAGGKWFVLDNRGDGFFEESALPHYLPLFAIDETGLKLFAVPFAASAEPADVKPGLNADAGGVTLGTGFEIRELAV